MFRVRIPAALVIGDYMRFFYFFVLIFTTPFCPSVFADEAPNIKAAAKEKAAVYHTREERREAGLGIELTDWLKISGLIETEYTSYEYYSPNDNKTSDFDATITTGQLAIAIQLNQEISAEVILELEEKSKESNLDEAFINYEKENYKITLGRLYLPFGIYYSHFITGPLLEFGETRGNSLVLEYDLSEYLEVTGFVFKGAAHKNSNKHRDWDWGATLAAKYFDENLELGVGYLSDLADSDEQFLLDDNNKYQQQVSAWNTYMIARYKDWELTLESLWATNKFRELEANEDQPGSWNLEAAYFIDKDWELAARYEQSEELADEPERQYGVAATWHAYRFVTLGAEYLRGYYQSGFVFDANDQELAYRNTISARLTLEF